MTAFAGRAIRRLVYGKPVAPSPALSGNVCYLNGFGERNPDKYFYIIRQPGRGRGLFSLYSSVLCHLHLADKHSLIPAVDFENFVTEYNDEQFTDSLNAWEYYFLPISPFCLREIYASKNVIMSSTGYPEGYQMSITNMPDLEAVATKYIQVRPEIEAQAIRFYKNHIKDYHVLGVHFRGQEMRTAPGHWFPPTKAQMAKAIRQAIDVGEFEKIFVVTEDAGYLEFLRGQFGHRIVASDHYRTRGANAYRVYSRPMHKYILGREVLVDAIILGLCNGLVACTSNVAEAARFFNARKFCYQSTINNGPNSANPLVARYLWFVKASLPEHIGGFKLRGRI